MKICGIYKITNTVTNDFYIGSSKNVKQRFTQHKKPSTWKQHPNNPMYLDMKKYGTNKFVFEILEEVEIEYLKETEQHFIETLKPTYNNYNAKGLNVERCKEYRKEYNEKYKEEILEQNKQYRESHKEEILEQKKQYYESHKEEILEQAKQYYESHKEQAKQYRESHKEQAKQYYESHKEEILEQKKQYYESHKEEKKQYNNKYNNQLCSFNGETLTLCALRMRFRKQGIDHPTAEAKKYLLEQQQ